MSLRAGVITLKRPFIKALLLGAMIFETCLATALQNKLHEPLQPATGNCKSTAAICLVSAILVNDTNGQTLFDS